MVGSTRHSERGGGLMHLYTVTLFDRKAPDCQFIVALWARSRWAAYSRALKCGRVIDIQQAPGIWPLDARKASARVRES